MSYGNQTFGYNANGDMTSRTAHLGQAQLTTQYSYDAIGNMSAVILADGTNIEYIVDGKNRRIGKKVNGATVQKFVYLNQLEPVAELNADNTVKTLFVYGTKPHVPEYLIKDGEKYRVVSDERGSVRLVVKLSDGTIAQRIDYDEFGNVLTDTNPGFQPFYFAGGIYDLDTKLTKFGARDYDAKIGRWTSKDPIRFDGGFNHYNYCDGDPVNFVDVNGLNIVTTYSINFSGLGFQAEIGLIFDMNGETGDIKEYFYVGVGPVIGTGLQGSIEVGTSDGRDLSGWGVCATGSASFGYGVSGQSGVGFTSEEHTSAAAAAGLTGGFGASAGVMFTYSWGF